jgi:hypothetical protein
MKSAKPFLLAFFVVLLLLLTVTFSPNLFGYAWLAVVAVLLLGGFAWMFLQVVTELLSHFQGARAKILATVSLLALFALTAVLSVFYIWTFIASIVLFICLLWHVVQDFRHLSRKRSASQAPNDWQLLEQAQIPRASAKVLSRAKARLAGGRELRINCTARAGALGFSSHPLQMDE